MKIVKSLFILVSIMFLIGLATNSYFTDQATVSNNVFETGTWPTEQARIVINEVYYRGSAEWIELYNAGTGSIDIKGWEICDTANHCGSLNPAIKTDVAPGEFIMIAHDAADINSLSIPAGTKKIYYAGTKIAFNDSGGDGVILKNNLEVIIDQMSYGGNTTAFDPSCFSVASGHSLERNPKGLDTDTASDFINQPSPTPGSGL